MTMKWHGYAFGKSNGTENESLNVGPLPNRKTIALYRFSNGTIAPLAYFSSEQHAEECLRLLDKMFGSLRGAIYMDTPCYRL